MDQIEVEVVNAAGIQLGLEQGQDLLLGFKAVEGQLVGEDVAFSGITAGEGFLQSLFAFAAVVGMGGVEVVEAGFQEGVHHGAQLFHINLVLFHGKTHAAEAEILFDFREKYVHNRSSW